MKVPSHRVVVGRRRLLALTFLGIALVAVAQEDGGPEHVAPYDGGAAPADDRCSQICHEQTRVLVEEKEQLVNELSAARAELDQGVNDQQLLLQEVETLRKSLHQARSDVDRMSTETKGQADLVADTQRHLQAAQQQAEHLQNELSETRNRMQELTSITFVRQIQTEMEAVWRGTAGLFHRLYDSLMSKASGSGDHKKEDL